MNGLLKFVNGLLQDLRHAVRQLRKNPGFTAVAAITLALGIGASTAMFSVINSVLLRSLPFPNSRQLMVVSKTMSNGTPNAFSTPAFLELQEQGGLTGHMGAFSAVGKNLGGKKLPELVSGGSMNYDLQNILSVQPVRGRFFTPQEDVPGNAPVVLLSHSLWATRFESKPMLGCSIDLDGTPYTIVGIMPPHFRVLSNQEQFWIPLKLQSVNAQSSARNIHWLFAFMRLPGGMSQKQAEAQTAMIASRLKAQDPKSEGTLGVTLQTMGEFQYGNIKPALLLLMGAVIFFLLIACSNIANLLLTRRIARQREMSIRSALGAVRIRLVRQLLTESILLSVTSGLLGLGFAWAAIRVLVAIHPSSIPSVQTIGMDTTVLAYSALICIIVGILFGIGPHGKDRSQT